MSHHSTQGLRVYNVGDDVEGCICQALGAGPLVKHLAPLAKTGAAKPSQRTEGAMALLIIAATAAVDAAAAKEATKENVFEEALK
jgi:hypothetical protein